MAKKTDKTTASASACSSSCTSTTWCAVIVLLVGILYLLQDLGAITWWTYNWWTIAFLLFGLKKLYWSMQK